MGKWHAEDFRFIPISNWTCIRGAHKSLKHCSDIVSDLKGDKKLLSTRVLFFVSALVVIARVMLGFQAVEVSGERLHSASGRKELARAIAAGRNRPEGEPGDR